MGQQSSVMGGNVLPSPRRKVKKPPRPSEPPKIPKPPKHVVPENKVIPNGVDDNNMEKARKLLRPVSQELTKFHPEFADIFQYDSETDFLAGGDETSLERSIEMDRSSKVNNGLGLSDSLSAIPTGDLPVRHHENGLSNGEIPNGNASLPNGLFDSKTTDDLTSKTSPSIVRLRRSQSMQRDGPSPTRFSLHKRQSSAVNILSSVNQPIIIEDPREHLYNVTRSQPFSNMMPSAASLPLENSFGLDYSFNVTYAQLAEYRRQRRMTELEDKTGKKLSDLGAEISTSNIVPKSPFDRKNVGTKSGPLSVSTGSSETGVSKSKKKRAPPPPGHPPGERFSDSGYKSGSEPPADYDMEDFCETNNQRRSSSASENLKKIAPQPFPKRMSVPILSHSETDLAHRVTHPKDSIPPQLTKSNDFTSIPSVPPPPPPPPPPATLSPSNSESISSVTTTIDTKPINSNNKRMPVTLPGQTLLHESVNLAKAHLEVLERLENSLKNPKPKEDAESRNPEKAEDVSEPVIYLDDDGKEMAGVDFVKQSKDNDNRNPALSDFDNIDSKDESEEKSRTTENAPPQTDEARKSLGTPDVRKMSTLLQHDIILAAQARGAKVIKAKPPPALDKPLDASELFRKELAKAASAREERRRQGSLADELESRSSTSLSSSRPSTPLNMNDVGSKESECTEPVTERNGNDNITSQGSDSVLLSNNVSTSVESENGLISEVVKSKTDLDTEFLANGFNKTSKQPSIHSEDMSTSSGTSQRIFSSNWIPEDDLESDDDIMANGYVTGNQYFPSEGFKSSVIPSKISELKGKKKEKKGKMKKKDTVSTNENGKMESVRKFRSSVQSSMKNAFGSISRASGKLLRKHKSQDFLDAKESRHAASSPRASQHEPSTGSNWEMTSSLDRSIRRSLSEEGMKNREYTNGEVVSDSSSNAASDVGDIDFSTGLNEMPKSKPKKTSRKQLKLAGVAYVSGTGDVIVVSDKERSHGNGDLNDKKTSMPKLFGKKDEFRTSSSMDDRRDSGERDIFKEIREKERLLDLERQKQQEMEKNYRRLRDLETQERLQRLQTETMRQQITMLQQQQIQQAHEDLNSSSLSSSSSHSLPNNQMGGNTPVANSSVMASSPVDFATIPTFPRPFHTSNLGYSQPHIIQQGQPAPMSGNVMGQNMQLPLLPGSFNTSQFTTHSAPIIGSSAIGPNLQNLSNQELSYLSDYMRMMGVQPPTTQQQWSLLLSSVQLSSQGFGHQSNPNLSQVPLRSNGPDLSRLFGAGKRLETTLVELPQEDFPGLDNQAPPIRPYSSPVSTIDNDSSLGLHRNLPLNNASSDGLQNGNFNLISDKSTEKSEPQKLISDNTYSNKMSTQNIDQSELPPSFENANDSAIKTGLSETSSNGLSNHVSAMLSSPEERIDVLTSKDDPTQSTAQKDDDSLFPRAKTLLTPKFSPKVYGPIGFRPVSFSAGTSS